MDNITHTLFGLTLARTRLGRVGRGSVAALVIASNAPDVDIVTALGGTGSYLTWHRGPTHGALGILGLGLLTAAGVWMGTRRARKASADGPPASLTTLILLSMVGVAGHILLDLPTAYGTRVLSPFSWGWFSVDLLPIVDLYLLMALAAGLVFGRMSQELRRPNVAIALVLMAGNYGLRAAAHYEAIALAPQLFGPALPARCDPAHPTGVVSAWPVPATSPPSDRRCLVDVAALPTFLSPFRWTVIAQTSDAYEVQQVNLLDAKYRQAESPGGGILWRRSRHFPNPWTATVVDAARAETARTFLGFSRFPLVRAAPGPEGVITATWTDMRFVGAPTAPGTAAANPFSVAIQIAPDGRILREGFGR